MNLTGRLVDDPDSLDVKRWRELFCPGSAAVYTSPEWCFAAWSRLPQLGSPLVVAVEDTKGHLFGVLPLARKRGGVAAVGGDLLDEVDVRCDVDIRDNVVRTVAQTVMSAHGVGLKSIEDISPEGNLATVLSLALGDPAPHLSIPRERPDARDRFETVPGWSTEKRKKLRYQLRRLKRTANVEFTDERERCRLQSQISDFAERRMLSWRTRERLEELSPVNRDPRLAGFLVELAFGLNSTREGPKVHLFRLMVDGVAAAQAYCFECAECTVLYMTTYDTRFRNYSPGHLLFAEIAQRSHVARNPMIDLGRGAEAYKMEFGANSRTLKRWRIDKHA